MAASDLKSPLQAAAINVSTDHMPRRPEKILPFRDNPDTHSAIRMLLNLGPKSAAWLEEAGINSVEQVRELGPVEVCRRVRAGGHPVSVLMAYALEGALAGCHWNAIPWETRQALRIGFSQMKAMEIEARRKSRRK